MNKIIYASIAIVLGLALAFAIGFNAGKSSVSFGGTTADDWNVGGNLTVTGTSALTGATTLSGALTVSGVTSMATNTVSSIFVNGSIFSTSTYSVGTSTAAELCSGASVYQINPLTPTATLYLPATTTLYADCLTQNGSQFGIKVYVSTSTSAQGGLPSDAIVTIARPTWVSGGGIALGAVTSTDALKVGNGEWVDVTFTRLNVTTTTVDVVKVTR